MKIDEAWEKLIYVVNHYRKARQGSAFLYYLSIPLDHLPIAALRILYRQGALSNGAIRHGALLKATILTSSVGAWLHCVNTVCAIFGYLPFPTLIPSTPADADRFSSYTSQPFAHSSRMCQFPTDLERILRFDQVIERSIMLQYFAQGRWY